MPATLIQTAYDLLPDLFDEHADKLSLAQPIFKDLGNKKTFSGEIITVSCFNDNSKVKELVATNGTGKVMVVDGQASTSNALLGDMLAEKALANGWQAIVINGCIRDANTIAKLNLAVKALGCNPIKTEKRGMGSVNVPVTFAGIAFIPGHYIYGDTNGLAVSEYQLEIN